MHRGCWLENMKEGGGLQDLDVDAKVDLNRLRMALLNCLNERSRGLTFRQRAYCI